MVSESTPQVILLDSLVACIIARSHGPEQHHKWVKLAARRTSTNGKGSVLQTRTQEAWTLTPVPSLSYKMTLCKSPHLLHSWSMYPSLLAWLGKESLKGNKDIGVCPWKGGIAFLSLKLMRTQWTALYNACDYWEVSAGWLKGLQKASFFI